MSLRENFCNIFGKSFGNECFAFEKLNKVVNSYFRVTVEKN